MERSLDAYWNLRGVVPRSAARPELRLVESDCALSSAFNNLYHDDHDDQTEFYDGSSLRSGSGSPVM
jgi:hypothetical protein